MSIAKNLCGAGMAPVAAQAIAGDMETGVTATGSTSQANSYLIQKSHTVVGTTAANTGVRLPAGLNKGDWGTITNLGASTLFVYPPTGGAINGGSGNAKVDLATLLPALWVAHGNGNFSLIVGA